MKVSAILDQRLCSSALYGKATSVILAGVSTHDLAMRQSGIKSKQSSVAMAGEHPSARCLPCLEENTVAGQEVTQWKTASQS